MCGRALLPCNVPPCPPAELCPGAWPLPLQCDVVRSVQKVFEATGVMQDALNELARATGGQQQPQGQVQPQAGAGPGVNGGGDAAGSVVGLPGLKRAASAAAATDATVGACRARTGQNC